MPLTTVWIMLCQLGFGMTIIMPLTKPDGSVDLSSLNTHLAFLEQRVLTLQSNDHNRELEIANLTTPVRSSRGKLLGLEMKVNSTEAELKKLKSQLGYTGIVPPTQPPTEFTRVKTDVDVLKKDVSSLHISVSKAQGNLKSNMGTILSEMSTLRHHVTILEKKQEAASQRNSSARAIFVRWGRSDCPDGNDLVYQGYAGGKYYNNKGSGSNILCLTNNTMYGRQHSMTLSRIYGMKYEGGVFTTVSSGDDVPCAVCQSADQANSVMVPARNECFPGWDLQYSGFIMSSYYSYYSTEYICVDHEPEPSSAGNAGSLQGNLYPVSAMCGALECPPYSNGLVITCAVCTK